LRVRRAAVSVQTIARITGLETLCLQRTVPGDGAAVGALSSLRRLSTLEYDGDTYDGYRVVPVGLDRLVRLSVLRLIRCDVPDGLECVSRLPCLAELHCTEVHVTRIQAPTTLTSLSLHRCHDLTDASALSSLVQLRSLTVTSCAGLRDLSCIAGLVRLERVDVSCDVPRDLSCYSRLTNLRVLSVHVPSGVRGIAALSALSSLTELRVGSFAAKTEEDAALAIVPGIRRVTLNGCSSSLCEAIGRRPDLRSRVRAHLM
jgi:hypothetical protein